MVLNKLVNIEYGDKFKVGRATFVCKRPIYDMNVYDLNGKCIANVKKGYVKLKAGSYIFRGLRINVNKDGKYYSNDFMCIGKVCKDDDNDDVYGRD